MARPGHRLAELIAELSSSPSKLAAYRRDRRQICDDAGLSELERQALESGDWKRICQLAPRPESAAQPLRFGVESPRKLPASDGSLVFVGTGFRVIAQVTAEARACLEAADRVYTLGLDPITEHWLAGVNPETESLAAFMAPGRPRAKGYREIVDFLVAAARRGGRLCVALYGHPGIFVDISHQAIRRARAAGLEASMLPAISAEDCLFADLGIDPATDGRQSFEATDFLLRRRRPDISCGVILWQIGALGVDGSRHGALWNRQGLEILTEVLSCFYPGDHQVLLYEASFAQVCEPVICRLRLDELAAAAVTVASTLYIPPAAKAPVDRDMARRLGLHSLL